MYSHFCGEPSEEQSYEVESAGQSPVPEAGEEHPLAPDQLRLGEPVRGVVRTLGGSRVNRCVKEGMGGPVVSESRECGSWITGFQTEYTNRFAWKQNSSCKGELLSSQQLRQYRRQ